MFEGPRDRKWLLLGLAAFLVGSTVGAVAGDDALLPGVDGAQQAGCAQIEPEGEAVEPLRRDQSVQRGEDHARRLVRWTLEDAAADRGVLAGCVRVGTVSVEPSPSDAVQVYALVEARGPDSGAIVDAIELDGVFSRGGETVGLAVGQVGAPPAQVRESGNEYQVSLRVQVPAQAIWSTRLDVGTGQARVEQLRTREVQASVGTGEVEIDGVQTHGPVKLSVGTGEIDLATQPRASGLHVLDVGTGEVDAQMARDSNTGFEVTGHTGSGDVDIEIGPTEERSGSGDDRGPSDRGYARSEGYADKRVQIEVEASASIGDVDVTAE